VTSKATLNVGAATGAALSEGVFDEEVELLLQLLTNAAVISAKRVNADDLATNFVTVIGSYSSENETT
jgi:hypothetical protein